MKLTICFLFVFNAHFLMAQDATHFNVVMAMSKGDSTNQIWLARQLINLMKALPNAKVEVVCYGPGLTTLLSDSCRIKNEILNLSAQGVVFAACENSMSGMGVKKEHLVAQSTTVRAGIAELVLRQSQGWSYIFAPK